MKSARIHRKSPHEQAEHHCSLYQRLDAPRKKRELTIFFFLFVFVLTYLEQEKLHRYTVDKLMDAYRAGPKMVRSAQ